MFGKQNSQLKGRLQKEVRSHMDWNERRYIFMQDSSSGHVLEVPPPSPPRTILQFSYFSCIHSDNLFSSVGCRLNSTLNCPRWNCDLTTCFERKCVSKTNRSLADYTAMAWERAFQILGSGWRWRRKLTKMLWGSKKSQKTVEIGKDKHHKPLQLILDVTTTTKKEQLRENAKKNYNKIYLRNLIAWIPNPPKCEEAGKNLIQIIFLATTSKGR